MGTIPKVAVPSRDVPSSKAGRSAGAAEELNAWLFIRMGLGLSGIVVAGLVMEVLRHFSADLILSALGLLAFFSIAIWGGNALVAIPTLLVQRLRRPWAHRRSKLRAGIPGLWDDWIDGPRTG
jgi:hypothetical protein